MTGEGGTEAESSGLVNTLQRHVDDIRGLIQCGICVRPLYEPFTIACGHTFCYSCLASWFAAKKSKRTCPDCRALVKDQPAPAYLVRAIVQMFTSRTELLDKEYTTAEHSKNHQEESERLDKDKANTDPITGGLFGGLFKPPQPKPIVDIEDGVTRCPLCSYELEDGLNCQGCGYIYQPDSEGTDYSGSDISESDLGSMIEGDTSDEDDYDPVQVPREEPVRQYPQPGSFDFNADYTDFFMHAFPHGIPGLRMNWPHMRVNHSNHSTHYWTYARPNPYHNEADEDDEDEEQEEEEEEEEEDEYGGSFIDDGEEEEDNEEEESQSDRSTVVGQTRTYNHTFSRIPPLVRYPPVYGPTSAPEADYDWESEDDDAIARLRGPWHPNENIEVLSEGDSHEIQSSSVYGADEIEDADEDEDSDNPHMGIGCRHYQPTSMDFVDDDQSENACSSSPPMARQPRARPSRDTGSSARDAITIDDSDEDPVGPVRRTGQRRQVRFSPY